MAARGYEFFLLVLKVSPTLRYMFLDTCTVNMSDVSQFPL